MQVTLETNVQEVIRTLQRYQVSLRDIVEPPLERGALRFIAEIKPYPPAIPDSRYVRGAPPHSEKLGSRWTSRRIQSPEFIGREVGNNASYAPWVQSRELQATVHQGRWLTDEDVIDSVSPAIAADVERSLVQAAEQLGG